MSRADSTISVNIIGDARKLNKALGSAAGGVDNFGQKVIGGLVALAVVDKATDVLKGALTEADRLGDALGRLDDQLGPTLASDIDKISKGMAAIGLSRQDVLETAANFADLATAIGISDAQIAGFAGSVSATAGAIVLAGGAGGADLAGVVDLIGKAAGGSAKAAKTLGVSLTEGLDPAAQLTSILDQLKPTLDRATTGTGDLEQSQKELQARTETLAGELGEKLAPALNTVLGFIIDEIDAIPAAVAGFGMLGDAVTGFAKEVLSPLARVEDVLQNILGLFEQTSGAGVQRNSRGGIIIGPSSERSTTNDLRNWRERNGLGEQQGTP